MRKALVVAALAASSYAVWHYRAGSSAPSDADASDARLARDRFWIDHMPRSERESVQTFIMMSQHSAGVFNNTSRWRGAYEGFRFEQAGDEVRMDFPQTGDRDRVRVRARRCDERGMDFCLDLEGASRGVKHYYSRKGWEIKTVGDAEARLDAIMHAADEPAEQAAEQPADQAPGE